MIKVIHSPLNGGPIQQSEFNNESEWLTHLMNNLQHFAQFTNEIVQNSEAVRKRLGKEKRRARIEFAIDMFADLADENEKDIKAGTMTIEQALAAEVKMAQVQRRMLNSSTEMAYQEMAAMDLSAEYTPEKKAKYVGMVAAFLAAEPPIVVE